MPAESSGMAQGHTRILYMQSQSVLTVGTGGTYEQYLHSEAGGTDEISAWAH
jgi:hypothetical protein